MTAPTLAFHIRFLSHARALGVTLLVTAMLLAAGCGGDESGGAAGGGGGGSGGMSGEYVGNEDGSTVKDGCSIKFQGGDKVSMTLRGGNVGMMSMAGTYKVSGDTITISSLNPDKDPIIVKRNGDMLTCEYRDVKFTFHKKVE